MFVIKGWFSNLWTRSRVLGGVFVIKGWFSNLWTRSRVLGGVFVIKGNLWTTRSIYVSVGVGCIENVWVGLLWSFYEIYVCREPGNDTVT